MFIFMTLKIYLLVFKVYEKKQKVNFDQLLDFRILIWVSKISEAGSGYALFILAKCTFEMAGWGLNFRLGAGNPTFRRVIIHINISLCLSCPTQYVLAPACDSYTCPACYWYSTPPSLLLLLLPSLLLFLYSPTCYCYTSPACYCSYTPQPVNVTPPQPVTVPIIPSLLLLHLRICYYYTCRAMFLLHLP